METYGTHIVYSNVCILGLFTGILDLDMKVLEKTMDVNVCGGQYELLKVMGHISLGFVSHPFKSPKMKFEILCCHPNIDMCGNICLDILQDKRSSAYDMRTILISIQSRLGEPNTSSPLNTQTTTLWTKQEEYRKMMLKTYKPPSA
ncbi:hypothetical protein MKX01_031828 [Papaver californicum]|nr:hypothetical protein MKX01_031828 [Papaver californicum]